MRRVNFRSRMVRSIIFTFQAKPPSSGTTSTAKCFIPPRPMMFSLLLLVSVVGLHYVNGQIAQTNATCTSDYSWMGNSKSASPCLVVAQLDSQCNSGSWDIPAINYTNKYANPENQTATQCTCSWASYNLISACTACQGLPESIPFWGAYILGCSGKTTDNNYWPPKFPIPTDVRIPSWAATDPTIWPNQRFSPAEAKKIYQTSPDDLPTSSTSRHTPIGAIIGGVIGGAVVIALFIFCTMFLIRQHRRATHPTTHPHDMLAHSRKVSDTTVTSGNMTLLDSSSLRPIVQIPSSTNVQRGTSISSLPFFSTLIGRDSRATVGHTLVPQDPGLPPLEEVITPFTLPPTNDMPEKKHSEGDWPVFDQPSAPPQNAIRMSVVPSQTPPRKSGGTRYNPPAYTESDTATPTKSRHQHQDSIDSSLSTPVATETTDSTGRRGVHTPAHSGSSMAQMGMSTPVRASTSTFHTIQTSISTRRTSGGGGSISRGNGRSPYTGPSRESFSPSEIA